MTRGSSSNFPSAFMTSNLFLLRGWQEYKIGMSYFSAIWLTALNRDRKFFSVSIFSSRWADRRMYLPDSRPSLAKTSEPLILLRLAVRTSAIGEPVTNILSFGKPISIKYLLAASEYGRLISDVMSTICRLTSSGKLMSLHLLPASICSVGIFRRLALITARQELVSPRTKTASGRSSDKTS